MPTAKALKKRPASKASPKVNWAKMHALSELFTRSTLASRLGMSYGDKRDIYATLGYPAQTALKFADMAARYYRQDIAHAIIDAPVRACWRKQPTLIEQGIEDSPLELGWKQIAKDRRIFHYLSRVDRLASLGKYAVLYLGFDDGMDPSTPVKNPKGLAFLSCYSEINAVIETYDEDVKSPTIGQPLIYSLKVRFGTSDRDIRVHRSRVIHVAEDLLESEIEGMPRLESVYNRLQDLELVAGSSAEAFWRIAFPNFSFKKDADAQIVGGGPGDEAFQTEIENFIHGQRYMRTIGITPEMMSTAIADPTGTVSVLIDLIAGAVRIPKRILLGTERGELASTQDEENWANRITERQSDHCEPMILRPVIDRLIEAGILPEAQESYTIEWPEATSETPMDQAQVAKLQAETLALYSGTSGAESLIPPDIFLRLLMNLTPEVIEEIETKLGETVDESAQDQAAEGLAPLAVEVGNPPAGVGQVPGPGVAQR